MSLNRYVKCCDPQFFGMTEKGTKVIIYNLWEDDQGQVELDFDTDCFVSSMCT